MDLHLLEGKEMKHEKTFEAINKLKDVEIELHRLKNALEMANKALDAQRQWVGTVDCIGLALDLEAQAKRVESQTVQRTMLAAANGLRIIDKESKTP
jgi:hypothetical protein